MIDVLVAGAGPVGLAVAIMAASSGLDVQVVDPRSDRVRQFAALVVEDAGTRERLKQLLVGQFPTLVDAHDAGDAERFRDHCGVPVTILPLER